MQSYRSMFVLPYERPCKSFCVAESSVGRAGAGGAGRGDEISKAQEPKDRWSLGHAKLTQRTVDILES